MSPTVKYIDLAEREEKKRAGRSRQEKKSKQQDGVNVFLDVSEGLTGDRSPDGVRKISIRQRKWMAQTAATARRAGRGWFADSGDALVN